MTNLILPIEYRGCEYVWEHMCCSGAFAKDVDAVMEELERWRAGTWRIELWATELDVLLFRLFSVRVYETENEKEEM